MTCLALSAESLKQTAAAVGPVLGIETGGSIISLGVVAKGQITASFSRPLASHCSGLPAAIDECLEAAGITLRDLVGMAIGLGPGSFTGLRIGLSYAKGLARALGIPITGVASLDAIVMAARIAPRAGVVCPVIDARRGEVYAALYRFAGDALEKKVEEFAASTADLAALVGEDAVFMGDPILEEMLRLVIARGGRAVAVGDAERYLRGGAVAGIGAAQIAAGLIANTATLEPLYVRPSGAVRAD